MLAIRYRRASSLLEAELADEIVALDEQRGLCFGLSPVASDVWRLLEQPRTLDNLVETLLTLYAIDESTCRLDVEELLGTMVDEKLVHVDRLDCEH